MAIGSVDDVSLGAPCDSAARVKLALDAGEVKRLSADSQAKLVTMGLLGDRLVAIVPGRASERLSAGTVITGVVPPDATAVIAEAGQAFDVLTRIARRVDDALASTDLKSALADVLATAGTLHRLIEQVERGPGLLHLLIFDRAFAGQIRAVGPATRDAAASADAAIAKLDRTAADLSQIVAYVKSGQGTLGGVIYDPAIYEDLRTIVGGVRRNVILRTLGRFVLKHH